ncbi:MAG: metallophosphoesterase [Limnothrix sp.]
MVRIAQITDTHLLADPEAEMREVKTWYSLQKVLATVQAFKPEIIILTGDLAHEGEKEAYQHLKKLIDQTKISTYWLPGNHDDYELMKTELSSKFLSAKKLIHHKNWCFILLNSCLENAKYGEGTFAQTELDWLEEKLAENISMPTAIACHHHPISTDIDWLEQMSILNSSDFHKIIDKYPQVKTVFFGHIHHEIKVIQNAVQFLGTPATCTQVTPVNHEIVEGEIQSWQQPGFRLFELGDDGSVDSSVHRIQWF